MLIIQDILVSDDVVEKKFICNLNACKGACCVAGDSGAPLESDEMVILTQIYEDVKPYLTEEGKAAIEEQGLSVYYDEPKEYGTPLIDGAACAFVTFDRKGTALCGIEQAYIDGKTDFKKPISCHLYPIRIESNKASNFEALNYDKWDICNAACKLGEKEQLPVYKFLKEAITRKYGADFYDELDAGAEHFHKMKR